MDKMKRFIDCYVPVTTCNLRCSYCYITQNKKWNDKLPNFTFTPEVIGSALSKERLGGICHMNFCGGGETLLPPEMPEILRNVLLQGHYIMVVTNGLVTTRFEEILKFPKELLERLGFKLSFHYAELIKRNKLEVFFDNVNKIKEAGCSYSIEITPHDEIIEKIEEIKEICINRTGAMCHVTVARKDHEEDKSILSQYSREEYEDIWGSFESDLFRFKLSTFEVKRKEFCYAGEWSSVLNIGTGQLFQCYGTKYYQNIFDEIDKPIRFAAVGRKCPQPHCFNSHAFMTLGVIPEVQTPTYTEMRNRVTDNGDEWLNDKMKKFLSSKLIDNNKLYSKRTFVYKKLLSDILYFENLVYRGKNKVNRILKSKQD